MSKLFESGTKCLIYRHSLDERRVRSPKPDNRITTAASGVAPGLMSVSFTLQTAQLNAVQARALNGVDGHMPLYRKQHAPLAPHMDKTARADQARIATGAYWLWPLRAAPIGLGISQMPDVHSSLSPRRTTQAPNVMPLIASRAAGHGSAVTGCHVWPVGAEILEAVRRAAFCQDFRTKGLQTTSR